MSLAPPSRRRGRPMGGGGGGRERILAAAEHEFGAHGYDGATIRSIALRAQVDTALVHHYFGKKSDLFAAVVDIPVNPAQLLAAAFDGELEDAGERIVGNVVALWDSPRFRRRGVALARAAIGNRRSATLLLGFVSREIITRLAERLGPDEGAPRRASLVASQILGLIVARYVLEVEPLASMAPDELVRSIGPSIQRYLTGSLEPDSAGS